MPEQSQIPSQGTTHWVDCQIRIRYAETDQMGVVYYSNYLIWFEIGRSAYCRKQGFSYAEMEAQTESFLAVAEVSCSYQCTDFLINDLVLKTDSPFSQGIN